MCSKRAAEAAVQRYLHPAKYLRTQLKAAAAGLRLAAAQRAGLPVQYGPEEQEQRRAAVGFVLLLAMLVVVVNSCCEHDDAPERTPRAYWALPRVTDWYRWVGAPPLR